VESLTPIIGIEKGIAALQEWLWDNRYSQHAVETIAAHVAAEGTPTGCPELDPEDEATATEVFAGALPAVPSVSWQWDYGDRSGHWTDSAPVAAGSGEGPGCEPEPFEPSADDLADYAAWSAALALALPPVAGGSPFEPTAEDLADAAAYAALVDAIEDQRRAAEPPLWGYE
jgi:hypothetical protein